MPLNCGSQLAVREGSGSRLFCWVIVCLLGVVDSGVTQTPRYLIKARGHRVILRCSPMSGHHSVSWYQQTLGQGPQFPFEFYENMRRAKGHFPGRFSAQQFRDARSELNVSSLELSDSALHLCARSFSQPC
uniref:Immunoglobulin V-set domain-containing protein n=1 Tax=Balaenoptera musculus TaxID=9771 RepID=A0A8C0DWS3_BALMU